MVRFERRLSPAGVSRKYFNELIGTTAASCFGVAGMSSANARQGLWNRRDVRVRKDGSGLAVELHILAIRGRNIPMITRGIAARVRYTVEEATGLNVHTVNVFLEGIAGMEQ